MSVITRFPPSPTGYLHIGGARTALFNWLYAKKTGGKMVLRIEDTDRERSTTAATEAIFESLKWLGLDWHEQAIFQTARIDRHREVIQNLIAAGDAYYCFCDKARLDELREQQRAAGQIPKYDYRCRDLNKKPSAGESAVVRFRNPLNGEIVFNDVVRGRISISNSQLDDLVIARNDATPTYNLTAVVDDIDFGITHIIRGDDHINNTPRQINLYNALQARLPTFVHIPLILGEDGQRLSKRHGAVSVLAYKDMGILPHAMLNYLARLGWSYGNQEIFTLDEMVKLFDIKDINNSAATFDIKKLLWLNQKYIQAADAEYLAKELTPHLAAAGIEHSRGVAINKFIEVLRPRVQTLNEMVAAAKYIYAEPGEYDSAAAKKYLRAAAVGILQGAVDELQQVKNWCDAEIHSAVQKVMQKHAVKLVKIAQPIRVAVSGSATTPPIDVTLHLVGKAQSCARIKNAIKWIKMNRG